MGLGGCAPTSSESPAPVLPERDRGCARGAASIARNGTWANPIRAKRAKCATVERCRRVRRTNDDHRRRGCADPVRSASPARGEELLAVRDGKPRRVAGGDACLGQRRRRHGARQHGCRARQGAQRPPGSARGTRDGRPREPLFAWIEIRGRVVEFIEGEEADRSIDGLAQKYLGLERYATGKPGERRILLRIEPTAIHLNTEAGEDPDKLRAKLDAEARRRGRRPTTARGGRRCETRRSSRGARPSRPRAPRSAAAALIFAGRRRIGRELGVALLCEALRIASSLHRADAPVVVAPVEVLLDPLAGDADADRCREEVSPPSRTARHCGEATASRRASRSSNHSSDQPSWVWRPPS